ncbi:hypothetical protein BCV69DRAFT_87831 [Microstroma glucosiphilum]|uniref:Uncharacterized protein n=1 Tax=Pseudomicrostroma glucosiphilum TaxID=1684307 RepID=A0A316TXK7_9BASI|nr:hypothetical protein BCV69DRAFT_87831 [Pseudomicrostroma glucosiphilum]PWN17890.1 hypothetical protein BCV69DRAFT_87831 [Pseudomicrostroma glucosiphilum]
MPAFDIELVDLPSKGKLVPRRGGGGGGGGRGGGSIGGSSSGSSSSGKGGTSSSSSSSSSSGRSSYVGGSSFGGSRYPSSSTANGVARFAIPASAGAFAGRTAGGGTRGDIYGSARYGSGYPAGYGTTRGVYYGGGVGGLGFPFLYWPVFWGAGYGAYYGSDRYSNDTDRPGGAMTLYVLQAPANVNQSLNNFGLYGDFDSVDSARASLVDACGVGSGLAANYTVTPSQAVQTYRSSSFSLLLDRYDNLQPQNATDDDSIDTPIPSLPADVDTTYLSCLNTTLGQDLLLPSDAETSLAYRVGGELQITIVLLPALLLAFILSLV